MNKIYFTLALVVFLGLGLAASTSYAAGMREKGALTAINSYYLVGAAVKDSHGEYLGIVSRVIIDSGGHAFAVINHGDYDLFGPEGVNTPVPFEELRIAKTKSGAEKVTFKMDSEHLEFAPILDPTRNFDRQYEATIYEYYGIAPYWTENVKCSN